jgi:hypothetical protein
MLILVFLITINAYSPRSFIHKTDNLPAVNIYIAYLSTFRFLPL